MSLSNNLANSRQGTSQSRRRTKSGSSTRVTTKSGSKSKSAGANNAANQLVIVFSILEFISVFILRQSIRILQRIKIESIGRSSRSQIVTISLSSIKFVQLIVQLRDVQSALHIKLILRRSYAWTPRQIRLSSSEYVVKFLLISCECGLESLLLSFCSQLSCLSRCVASVSSALRLVLSH